VILEGTFIRGDTSSRKKKYRKQVLTIVCQQSLWHKPITFTSKDEEGVTYPYEDALVISTILATHRVHRVLMDDDSSINILSRYIMS
jgi:hypothetical protein